MKYNTEMLYDDNLKDYICRVGAPLIVVSEVTAHPDYTLLLTFSNGEKRIYDVRPLLEKSIFAPLKNIALFLAVKADGCSVAWNNEIDIDPKHLYEASIPIAE